MTSIRTSFCKDLHAKCYLNENDVIITSMNLYEFSQVNNNEMGIFIEKSNDPELYKEVYDEVQRLIRTSDEIIVSVEKAESEEKQSQQQETKPKLNLDKKKDFSKSKFKSTSALSKIMGIQSKELFEIFEGKGWIKKDGKSWILTPKGEQQGAQTKNGQYGEYVAWPEEIVEEI